MNVTKILDRFLSLTCGTSTTFDCNLDNNSCSQIVGSRLRINTTQFYE